MIAGLKEINSLVGVWGSFIVNNRGEVLHGLTPPQLKNKMLETIGSLAVDLLVSSNGQLNAVSEMVFDFSQRRLFILDLEKAILVVVGTPSVDLSLLRMTANVVRTEWDDDPKVQTFLAKNNLARG
jgi:predicted regulator of Ras-like GTPase activity (Roadblock/LC7/MglB family)